MQTKQKILFPSGLTQKVGLLSCFLLAFDNSKAHSQKRRFKIRAKKPQLIELSFYTSQTKNFFTLIAVQIAGTVEGTP